MDLLLILTYTALCIIIFKIFRIPANKWTVPTAALGGIALIGTLIFVMNYNHPYAEVGRKYFVTTPIVPGVSGLVTEVPAVANVPLKKGDVLFQIDATPFKNRKAALKAQLDMAALDLKRAIELVAKNAAPVRDRDQAQSRVDELTAQLAVAEYELNQTTVRAPTDGYCTQLILRPGMMAASFPLRPVMVFVHDEENKYVGWFRQNSLLRLQKEDAAEVAFDGIPGKIFAGKVTYVFDVLAEGQVIASGNLIDVSPNDTPGRIPVIIEITDPAFRQYSQELPGGAFGQTALYSKHAKHVAVIRKVLLRMASWLNYLFPFH
ncbi:MAG: HlyD family secretion protein [Proteobacteria bacterium]|nr:HlyD family secretion protein [Pseudomonadota bacterium]